MSNFEPLAILQMGAEFTLMAAGGASINGRDFEKNETFHSPRSRTCGRRAFLTSDMCTRAAKHEFQQFAQVLIVVALRWRAERHALICMDSLALVHHGRPPSFSFFLCLCIYVGSRSAQWASPVQMSSLQGILRPLAARAYCVR